MIRINLYGLCYSKTIVNENKIPTIHYTLDGSTPTESSAAYSTALSIPIPSNVKAKSFLNTYDPSRCINLNYTLKKISMVASSLPTGKYPVGSVDITLSVDDTPDGTTLLYDILFRRF